MQYVFPNVLHLDPKTYAGRPYSLIPQTKGKERWRRKSQQPLLALSKSGRTLKYPGYSIFNLLFEKMTGNP